MMNRSITAKPADHIIDAEGTLTIGLFNFEIFETPGHSPGSISYYSKEANAVFSGDVLFQMSIGRTDLPGGSFAELIGSIEEKLFVLPDETAVLCGHGPETSIGFEKKIIRFTIRSHYGNGAHFKRMDGERKGLFNFI